VLLLLLLLSAAVGGEGCWVWEQQQQHVSTLSFLPPFNNPWRQQRTAHHTHCAAGMPDIERLTRKLEARRTSLADLCQLYRASSVLPRLEDALRCHEVRVCACACNCVAHSPPFSPRELSTLQLLLLLLLLPASCVSALGSCFSDLASVMLLLQLLLLAGLGILIAVRALCVTPGSAS
jgi:hypothetical protein